MFGTKYKADNNNYDLFVLVFHSKKYYDIIFKR